MAFSFPQEYMPIETVADMAEMLLAVVHREGGDTAWLDASKGYWDLVHTWAQYLLLNLPVSPAQRYTNDFEAPFAGNINLDIKGYIGLAAYASLVKTHFKPAAQRWPLHNLANRQGNVDLLARERALPSLGAAYDSVDAADVNLVP